MSPNTPRTPLSASHTRRRRHAAPGNPTWVRRAGLVGGVVSALALSGAAAPAMADNTHHRHPAHRTAAVRGAVPAATAFSTLDSGRRAAAAIEQDAIDQSLAARKARAAREARRAAAAAKRKAAHEKAVAAATAARERAATARAAASRSAERARLIVTPTASATAAPSTGSTASSAASSSAGSPAATPAPSPTASPAAGGSVASLISFLKAQLGKPYVYGATGPGSYDCSGLTQAAFASVGVNLPRTSQEQSAVGTPVAVSAVQAGDLIFWGGEGSAYHVGVYIGNGQYLDAANPSTPVAIHQMADYMPDWAVRVL